MKKTGEKKTWLQDKAGSEISNIRISDKNKQLGKRQNEERQGGVGQGTLKYKRSNCKTLHVHPLHIAVQQEVLKKTTEVFQISGEGALWWSGGRESGCIMTLN